jgi:hypothetical protein
MTLPQFRLTVRQWMLLVALAILAIGGGIWGYSMRRLSRYYAGEAEFAWRCERYRRERAATLTQTARVDEKSADRTPGSELADQTPLDTKKQKAKEDRREAVDTREDAALWTARADHWAALARKYERAARYPWLAVEPDTPEP